MEQPSLIQAVELEYVEIRSFCVSCIKLNRHNRRVYRNFSLVAEVTGFEPVKPRGSGFQDQCN